VEEAFGWTALCMFNYMVRNAAQAEPPLRSALLTRGPALQTPLAGFVDEELGMTRELDIKGAKRARVAAARVG
jgi:hypothetical protein